MHINITQVAHHNLLLLHLPQVSHLVTKMGCPLIILLLSCSFHLVGITLHDIIILAFQEHDRMGNIICIVRGRDQVAAGG